MPNSNRYKSENDSHLYGVELINDLKTNDSKRTDYKNDYSRKSTTFSNSNHFYDSNHAETPFEAQPDSPLDPLLDRATPRRIKKRIKQFKAKNQTEQQQIANRV